MRNTMSEQRILRGATGAELSHQFHDAEGDAAAPSGSVTVAVTRSDGTSVTVGDVEGSDTAPRTVSIGVAELTVVDRLTAVWSLDGTAVATDVIDVVSGTVGSSSALKGREKSLAGTSDTVVKAARKAAEDHFVSIYGRLPFQRLEVQTFQSDADTRLGGAWWPDLAEVRWARHYTSATDYTELTAAQIAAIEVPDTTSEFRRIDASWPRGRIVVAYVAGMAHIPEDLFRAFAQATRREITLFNTGVPEQSATFAQLDGGVTVGLSRPGPRKAYGIDDIDSVFHAYRDPRVMA